MIRPKYILKNRGTILVLALWALTLLTVFAVNIGMRIQQKLTLLARLERKAHAQSMAVSAIRLARARFFANFKITGILTPTMLKTLRHNNEYHFASLEVDQGTVEISYNAAEGSNPAPVKMYGMVDEERKININKADAKILASLIDQVTMLKEEDAQKIATAIVDWRQYGESEIKGFYSDDYYENLEFPYTPKKENFQVIEELQLVSGVTPAIYDQLSRFVTVYGLGKVNVNTASKNVLIALGLDAPLVDKIITVRNGRDGKLATDDDEYFNGPETILAILLAAGKLTEREIQQVQEANTNGYLGSESDYYRVIAEAKLNNQKTNYVISCVFRGSDGKIISWREF